MFLIAALRCVELKRIQMEIYLKQLTTFLNSFYANSMISLENTNESANLQRNLTRIY